MSEPLKHRVRLQAPVPDLWRALTDEAALRIWLAEHVTVDLPERFEFWGRYTPDGAQPPECIGGDVRARKTVIVSGTVVDFATGAPVAGAARPRGNTVLSYG